MNIKQACRFILLALMCLFVITACDDQPPTLEQRIDYMIQQVRAGGAKVICVGQKLLVVLPVDDFFQLASTKLRHNKVPTVKQVALLVKLYSTQFVRPHIAIFGYTSNKLDRRSRKRLSREYAHVVAAYFWAEGIPRYRMIVRGRGARFPIASNRYPAGTAYNRRVEIRVSFGRGG